MATKVQDAIIAMANGVINYVDVRIDNANYVRTDIGKVKSVALVNGKYSHTVTIRNYDYSGVFSLGNNEFSANSVVYLLIPSGQYNQMFILGHLDDTLAHIKGGDINLGNGNFVVDNTGSVTIKQGSINLGSGNFVVDNSGSVTIKSGSITLGSNFSVTSAGAITIKSGSINLGNGNFTVDNNGSVTIKSGSITIGSNSNFSVNSSGTVTIKNGSINLGNGNFTVDNNGSVAIKSGSLNLGNGNFVVNSSGVITIKTGSINLGNGKFTVDNNGYMTATSGKIANLNIVTNGFDINNEVYFHGDSSGLHLSGVNQIFYGRYVEFNVGSPQGSLSEGNIRLTASGGAGCLYNDMYQVLISYASTYYGSGNIYFSDNGLTNNSRGEIVAVRQALRLRASDETDYGVVVGVKDIMWSFYPVRDGGYMKLGTPSYRWGQIYSTTSTINTSDRNQKNSINLLEDKKTKDFIMDLKPVSFKFNDGTSGRTHHGLIAQDVEDTLYKLNLSPLDFAGFCKDQKMREIQVPELDEDGNEVLDRDGNVVMIDSQEPIENEYTYGLRYEEFIPSLIKMVQMLQTEVEELKNKIGE